MKNPFNRLLQWVQNPTIFFLFKISQQIWVLEASKVLARIGRGWQDDWATAKIFFIKFAQTFEKQMLKILRRYLDLHLSYRWITTVNLWKRPAGLTIFLKLQMRVLFKGGSHLRVGLINENWTVSPLLTLSAQMALNVRKKSKAFIINASSLIYKQINHQIIKTHLNDIYNFQRQKI